jgi:hypothetical protein
MIDLNNYNLFLYINFSRFSLIVIDEKNKILFDEEFSTNDTSFEDHCYSLLEFLKNNIFKFESKLGFYIKNVNLIIDYDNFFIIDISKEVDFNTSKFDLITFNKSLYNINDVVKKNYTNYKIIHLIIEKFIIDDFQKSHIPVHLESKKFCVELKFICLEKKIIKEVLLILSQFQVSVDKIFCGKYLNQLKTFQHQNIFEVACNSLKGWNSNEVIFSKNIQKNSRFFEKFFEFFN